MAKYQCPECYANRVNSKQIEKSEKYNIKEIHYGCGSKAVVRFPQGIFEWSKKCDGKAKIH